jgi:hypothetical protein
MSKPKQRQPTMHHFIDEAGDLSLSINGNKTFSAEKAFQTISWWAPPS